MSFLARCSSSHFGPNDSERALTPAPVKRLSPNLHRWITYVGKSSRSRSKAVNCRSPMPKPRRFASSGQACIASRVTAANLGSIPSPTQTCSYAEEVFCCSGWKDGVLSKPCFSFARDCGLTVHTGFGSSFLALPSLSGGPLCISTAADSDRKDPCKGSGWRAPVNCCGPRSKPDEEEDLLGIFADADAGRRACVELHSTVATKQLSLSVLRPLSGGMLPETSSKDVYALRLLSVLFSSLKP
mmetsp:Transcript_41361/g.95183  ORF Transcript_41361/g.95183 Transcript_41361/m.95183 type:complete len:242 (+) Transcript_41361:2608-3333(+)